MTKKVAQYYDALSSVYDQATKGAGSWQAPRSGLELLIPHVNPGSRVLDLGAGTGQTVANFVDLGCEIFAADISTKMIESLKTKFPSVTCSQLDLENGLSEIKAENFDAIIAIGVLEFVKNVELVFEDVRSKLSPNGLFCFSTEEYIVDHPLQGLVESPCGIDIKDPNHISNFPVWRRTHQEVSQLVKDSSMELLKSDVSIAYYKTQHLYPIYYRYNLARAI